MNWLVLLGLAIVIVAVAAVTGMKAKAARPVAHTRMMGMARFVLVVLAVILAYAALR